MELYIDSADLQEIKIWSEILPLDGVTTSPSSIAKAGMRSSKITGEIFKIIGDDKFVHIQVVAKDYDGIMKEAYIIRDFHKNVYVKIPATQEGIKAIKQLSKDGIKITATAVATAHQGLFAAKAGAEYVAPYINRIDNMSLDGISVATDMVKMFKTYSLQSKVLAASFRNSQQVLKLFTAGIHSATISAEY